MTYAHNREAHRPSSSFAIDAGRSSALRQSEATVGNHETCQHDCTETVSATKRRADGLRRANEGSNSAAEVMVVEQPETVFQRRWKQLRQRFGGSPMFQRLEASRTPSDLLLATSPSSTQAAAHCKVHGPRSRTIPYVRRSLLHRMPTSACTTLCTDRMGAEVLQSGRQTLSGCGRQFLVRQCP